MENPTIILGDEANAGLTGWKFHRLREMQAANLPVPKFFCLTRHFYEEVLSGVREKVEMLLSRIDFEKQESVFGISAQIRSCLEQASLTAGQEQDILEAFDRTFGKDAVVSVRSSTVGIRLEESEDSADNPFAGMSDSFLYVGREQLLDCVRKCWSSGFNGESLLYRHEQGFDLQGFGVAVGIQEMVFGERSFVLFTCDPGTLSKDAVLVAGYGIGEGVVQEKVPVDHYFQNYYSGEIKKVLAEKTVKVTCAQEQGFGIAVKPVSEEQARTQCLKEEEISKIVSIGRKIEKLFLCPQDIEGTITEDGRIYILQARPVALDAEQKIIWSNTNITESFPGVTTVLTYTFARYFYRVIFYDFYKRMGASQTALHQSYEQLDHMIGFIKGRVYYSLSAFYYLHSLVSSFAAWRHTWEKMIGLETSYETPLYRSPGAPEGKRMTGEEEQTGWTRLEEIKKSHDRDMAEFHQWWEELFSPYRGLDFAGWEPLKLVHLFYHIWQEVGIHWGPTLNNDIMIQLSCEQVEQSMKGCGIEDGKLLSGMLCGDEKLLSVEIILSAVRLSELVQVSPQLKKEFEERTAKELWLWIEGGQCPQEFAEEVRKHLYWYGDRGLQELKVEKPSTRNAPWVLVQMIKDYAAQGMNREVFLSNERQIRRESEQKLEELLSERPKELSELKEQFELVRKVIRHRENSRYCRSELYGFSKNVFFALGRWLENKGVISCAKDVVHLTMEELLGCVNGMGTGRLLQDLIELRKREFDQNQKEELPMTFVTKGAVFEGSLPDGPEKAKGSLTRLKGLGSSSGKIRGIARIVTEPDQFERKQEEDTILIAKETDPGWLFLMLSAKGIVVERGSMLSHTAITGRKFGIPTVVAVENATKLIPDGAMIEIDGASGTVELLEWDGTARESKERGEL